MRFVILLIGVLVCSAHGQETAPVGKPGEVFSADAPARSTIDVHTDVAFGEKDYQKCDIFLPTGVARPPVVICWFGGAFWGGERVHMEKAARFFAENGFAAVTPAYFLGAKDGSVAAWPKASSTRKA